MRSKLMKTIVAFAIVLGALGISQQALAMPARPPVTGGSGNGSPA